MMPQLSSMNRHYLGAPHEAKMVIGGVATFCKLIRSVTPLHVIPPPSVGKYNTPNASRRTRGSLDNCEPDRLDSFNYSNKTSSTITELDTLKTKCMRTEVLLEFYSF